MPIRKTSGILSYAPHYMEFKAKWEGIFYIVPEKKVSFRSCLTGWDEKAEVIIPPAQTTGIRCCYHPLVFAKPK